MRFQQYIAHSEIIYNNISIHGGQCTHLLYGSNPVLGRFGTTSIPSDTVNHNRRNEAWRTERNRPVDHGYANGTDLLTSIDTDDGQ